MPKAFADVLAHRRIWADELEKLDSQRLALQTVCLDNLDKLSQSCKTKSHCQLFEDLRQQETRLCESRSQLHAKLFETLAFPIQYFELSKATLMEGYDLLQEQATQLEMEIILESKTPAFSGTDEHLTNPWILDKEEGDVRRLLDLNCADSSFAIQKFEELRDAQNTHSKKLVDLKREFNGYTDDLDGWEKSTHFRFDKIRLEYKSVNDRKLYQNRLDIEFPTLSSAQRKFHIIWIQKHHGYKARLTALTKNHHTHISNLIKSILLQFPIQSKKYLAKLRAESSLQECLSKIEERHRKLYEWRRTRIEEIRREEEQREKEAALAAMQHAERELERLERISAKKETIREFQEQKRLSQLSKIQAFEEEKHQHLLHQLSQKQRIKERVDFRASEQHKKSEALKLDALERENARLEIERKLDALRKSVAVHVESDWSRILQPTEAFKVSKQTEKLPSLFVNHSFTVAALMKDRRFRVSQALHAAGLQHSEYARRVLTSLNGNWLVEGAGCEEGYSMSSEIRQILEAETLVDIDKLRQAGRYGISDEVRADAWKYLLGVEAEDKSNELSKRQAKYDEYRQTERQSNDVMKRIRGEVSRYCKARNSKVSARAVSAAPPTDPTVPIENVVSAYLSHFRGTEYSPVMIYLSGPFAYLMPTEADIYYSFIALMEMVETHYAQASMAARLSEFLMLFRTLLPDLHNHFEEEEVDFKEVATSWFEYLLAKELPLDCLLRLWDTYFSIPNGLTLHVYICLAVLSLMKDHLEELEQSEIHGVLLRLPVMDMDSVIKQAVTIRDEVMMKRLI
ncbi:hypothetical protein HDU78_002027 [Chytriomyces hyalinus]|nr:hypothetical protein HDU78_002027 [Chytriomyces hyalinus]